jgi:hypothetical protein
MSEDRQRLHPAENSLAQMAAADDTDLLQSAKEGDAAAFDALIRRHDRFLYRVARSVLLDDYEAEDVVQETFIKAFKHLEDFRGEARTGGLEEIAASGPFGSLADMWGFMTNYSESRHSARRLRKRTRASLWFESKLTC